MKSFLKAIGTLIEEDGEHQSYEPMWYPKRKKCNSDLISLSWVLDRHKLTVFYLNSFAMDSVQVGKAVFVK